MKEVRELAPLADVYKLNPNETYLFVVDLNKVPGLRFVKQMQGSGISATVVTVNGLEALRIFKPEVECVSK